ncbi:MAG: T9SS type A sorting domain-containing protein, partial [Bacteroidales bacterium]|nr:T9SS type A sorting domain-containing protein [Bacteroidales bacterium]
NLQGSTISVSSEANPEFSYSTAGYYGLQLIAYGIVENDTLVLNDYFVVHDAPVANFSVNSTEIHIPGEYAIFENNSENANNYFWDFGNGSTSTDSNPYCVYTTEGSYTVSLTASNDWCPESLFVLDDDIVVTTITKNGILCHDNFYIYPNPVKDFLEINSVKEISKISIINNLGQVVFTSNDSELKRLDISGFANGIYMMEIVSGEEKYLRKIVVNR